MLINIPLLERKAIKERVDFFPLPSHGGKEVLRNNHLSSSGNNRARTKSPSVYTAGHARSKRVTAVEILFGLHFEARKIAFKYFGKYRV